MRIPSLLIATILLGSSAFGQREEKSPWYFQLSEGLVFTTEAEDVPGDTIGFDPGFAVGGSIGYEVPLGEHLSFAPEVELFYQSFTVDEDDINAIPSAVEDDAKTFSVMLNGHLDWHITDQFSLYGGMGVGWAREIEYESWDSGNLVIPDNDGVCAQVRLGAGWNFGGDFDFRLGLRSFVTEPIDIEDTITGETDELEVAQLSVETSFRWRF